MTIIAPVQNDERKISGYRCLMFITTLVACKSWQNEGGLDWATVEFSIDKGKGTVGGDQTNCYQRFIDMTFDFKSEST